MLEKNGPGRRQNWRYSRSAFDIFCRPDTGATPPAPKVKGQDKRLLFPFDFRHRRRQTVNMAATDIDAAHKIFLLLLAPTKWIYTKFGIDSKEHHLIRLSHALCR